MAIKISRFIPNWTCMGCNTTWFKWKVSPAASLKELADRVILVWNSISEKVIQNLIDWKSVYEEREDIHIIRSSINCFVSISFWVGYNYYLLLISGLLFFGGQYIYKYIYIYSIIIRWSFVFYYSIFCLCTVAYNVNTSIYIIKFKNI